MTIGLSPFATSRHCFKHDVQPQRGATQCQLIHNGFEVFHKYDNVSSVETRENFRHKKIRILQRTESRGTSDVCNRSHCRVHLIQNQELLFGLIRI